MALSNPTTLSTQALTVSTGATQTWTATAFTSVNNSLLVVFVYGFADGWTPNASSSLSGASLTWTRRLNHQYTDGTYNFLGEVWTAPVTTGASTTLSWSNAGSGSTGDQDHSLWVGYFTGHDTSTPTGSSVEALFATGATSTTQTLSGAPSSTSVVISGISCASEGVTGVTPGTGYTELYEGEPNHFVPIEIMYRGSSTSTSCDRSAINSGGVAIYDQFWAWGLEIKAAAVTTYAPPPYHKPLRFFRRSF